MVRVQADDGIRWTTSLGVNSTEAGARDCRRMDEGPLPEPGVTREGWQTGGADPVGAAVETRACLRRRVHDRSGMDSTPSKDPLHGVTLKQLLTELVAEHGWPGLAARVDIRCFRFDPSINSSLVFLRRTPWARKKVEELYVQGKAR